VTNILTLGSHTTFQTPDGREGLKKCEMFFYGKSGNLRCYAQEIFFPADGADFDIGKICVSICAIC